MLQRRASTKIIAQPDARGEPVCGRKKGPTMTAQIRLPNLGGADRSRAAAPLIPGVTGDRPPEEATEGPAEDDFSGITGE